MSDLPADDNAPAGDRAVALMRELVALKIDGPRIAPFSERAWARVIDTLVLGVLVLITSGAWSAIANATGHFHTDPATGIPRPDRYAALSFDIALVAVILGYELLPAMVRVSTPGKLRVGLRVVTRTGEPAGLGRSLVRFLAWFIPFSVLTVLSSAAFPSIAGTSAVPRSARRAAPRGLEHVAQR